jgi:hypothetical protein
VRLRPFTTHALKKCLLPLNSEKQNKTKQKTPRRL